MALFVLSNMCAIVLLGVSIGMQFSVWHTIEPWVCPSLAIANNTGGGAVVKISREGGGEIGENKMGGEIGESHLELS